MPGMRPQVLQRPLRLHPGFVRKTYLGVAAAVIFGLLGAVGASIWQFNEARALMAAIALWQSGTEAQDANVEGHETSHNFLLNSYDLNVEYVDQQGGLHKRRLEFSSLFASVDQKSPVIVKYDPQNPERFAFSWMIDIKGTAWASIALMELIGLGVGLLGFFSTRQLLQKLAAARRAAVDSEESSVALVKIVEMRQNGRATGVMKYQYDTTDAAGKAKRREVLFNVKKQQAPLYIDKAGSRMFVLKPPAPHQPVVLRNDFYPFDVPAHDRPALLARLERLRDESGEPQS
jgi:hypothetical protein